MHAYVFNTMNSVFYIIIMYICCTKPIASEAYGVLFAILGCSCLYLDSNAERQDNVVASPFDYLVTISCSLSGALYFMISAKLIQKIPMFILLAMMSFYCFILSFFTAKIMDS